VVPIVAMSIMVVMVVIVSIAIPRCECCLKIAGREDRRFGRAELAGSASAMRSLSVSRNPEKIKEKSRRDRSRNVKNPAEPLSIPNVSRLTKVSGVEYST